MYHIPCHIRTTRTSRCNKNVYNITQPSPPRSAMRTARLGRRGRQNFHDWHVTLRLSSTATTGTASTTASNAITTTSSAARWHCLPRPTSANTSTTSPNHSVSGHGRHVRDEARHSDRCVESAQIRARGIGEIARRRHGAAVRGAGEHHVVGEESTRDHRHVAFRRRQGVVQLSGHRARV